jgi:anti-anti-sigma regulatory factor
MFKIRRSDGKFVVFALSGRITAARLPELQALLESEPEDHAIALDLRELKLADRDAVRFLASCEANGMKLANCPPYIRAWIEKEAAQSEES